MNICKESLSLKFTQECYCKTPQLSLDLCTKSVSFYLKLPTTNYKEAFEICIVDAVNFSPRNGREVVIKTARQQMTVRGQIYHLLYLVLAHASPPIRCRGDRAL